MKEKSLLVYCLPFPLRTGLTDLESDSGSDRGDDDGRIGAFKVISVDYRMPPEAYFPAAIDDVLTVYKALQRPDPARSA
jgi:hypothetical protein